MGGGAKIKRISKETLHSVLLTQGIGLISCLGGFLTALISDEHSGRLVLAWFVALLQCIITCLMVYRYEGDRIACDILGWLEKKTKKDEEKTDEEN